jgi:hypothetical protein
LENNILVQKGGNVDLMESIPIEAEEVEALMSQSKASASSAGSKSRGATAHATSRNGVRSGNGAVQRKSRSAKFSL